MMPNARSIQTVSCAYNNFFIVLAYGCAMSHQRAPLGDSRAATDADLPSSDVTTETTTTTLSDATVSSSFCDSFTNGDRTRVALVLIDGQDFSFLRADGTKNVFRLPRSYDNPVVSAHGLFAVVHANSLNNRQDRPPMYEVVLLHSERGIIWHGESGMRLGGVSDSGDVMMTRPAPTATAGVGATDGLDLLRVRGDGTQELIEGYSPIHTATALADGSVAVRSSPWQIPSRIFGWWIPTRGFVPSTYPPALDASINFPRVLSNRLIYVARVAGQPMLVSEAPGDVRMFAIPDIRMQVNGASDQRALWHRLCAPDTACLRLHVQRGLSPLTASSDGIYSWMDDEGAILNATADTSLRRIMRSADGVLPFEAIGTPERLGQDVFDGWGRGGTYSIQSSRHQQLVRPSTQFLRESNYESYGVSLSPDGLCACISHELRRAPDGSRPGRGIDVLDLTNNQTSVLFRNEASPRNVTCVWAD